MRIAYDCIMALEALVQSRVPHEVAGQVTALAASEGLSVAAWIRRLLIREVTRMRVLAWAVPGESTPFHPGTAPAATCVLERVGELSAVEVVFHVLDKSGAPEPLDEVSRYGWFKEPEKYRFHLDGSPKPWIVVRTLWDSRSGRAELVLRMT